MATNTEISTTELFIWACEDGDLTKAKQLYDSGNVNIRELAWVSIPPPPRIYRQFYPGALAFHLACAKGRLDVAKWLYNLEAFDIYAVGDAAYRAAYVEGHLEVVKWWEGFI